MNIHDLKYGMQRKPSSEYRLHAALYRRYPECNAIITPTPTASVHSLQPTPDSGFRNRRWIS